MGIISLVRVVAIAHRARSDNDERRPTDFDILCRNFLTATPQIAQGCFLNAA
ncbi:MAG TPA: hypothetical protein VGM81_01915 [Burkholderiaceae bacterium]